MRYGKQSLEDLEAFFEENGYTVRYEKGNFKAGYCVLKHKKIVIINKFADLRGKIDSLLLLQNEMVQLIDSSQPAEKRQDMPLS